MPTQVLWVMGHGIHPVILKSKSEFPWHGVTGTRWTEGCEVAHWALGGGAAGGSSAPTFALDSSCPHLASPWKCLPACVQALSFPTDDGAPPTEVSQEKPNFIISSVEMVLSCKDIHRLGDSPVAERLCFCLRKLWSFRPLNCSPVLGTGLDLAVSGSLQRPSLTVHPLPISPSPLLRHHLLCENSCPFVFL